ncbi:MAG TPA: PilC/PilY family type IV pilus protein [Usitatibacter sp.]|nr:PilC/PilY family type IV pilus protein [Usitatibacter sp.]
MERLESAPILRTRLVAAALTLALAAFPASGALIDISPTPLASSSSGVVKPNISFVLDASGSMAWSHAPDESQPFFNSVGYKSSQCNSIYYRPDIAYVPAKHSDGTDFPNSSFTAAWTDGIAQTGSVNLATSFTAFTATTGASPSGTAPSPLDTAQPAYYYTYTGSAPQNYQDPTSTFYRECMIPTTAALYSIITISSANNVKWSSVTVGATTIASNSGSTTSSITTIASQIASKINSSGTFTATVANNVVWIFAPNSTSLNVTPVVNKSAGSLNYTATALVKVPFQKVVVSTTSGPGGTDETQNFANWYSYYRTRILMMKSGAGRAFASIGSTYRVGFFNIQTTPSAAATTNYLPISDFDQTQKDTWYTKFYAQSPNSGTPLRVALSKAGRNYAGKLGADPVQYSCQQNFLILTTDGYWNNDTNYPVDVNGNTLSTSQDSNASATPRPQYDGGLTTKTLADAAAYYYNTDLRNSSLGNCTGALGSDVCNDNVPVSGTDNKATQHMTTFTLGLGTNGQLQFSSDYLTGGSADFNAIVSGTKDWPIPTGDTLTTIDDLWHAAVNGHGEYFSAKNPDLLVSGLRTALAGVSTREASGAAAATSNLEPVAGDNFAFVANYRTVKWDGDVQARTIDLVTGSISSTAVWSGQSTIDASVGTTTDTRTIFTFLNGAKTNFDAASLATQLTTAQMNQYFSPTSAPLLSQATGWSSTQTAAATTATLVNYLRGENGFEERGSNAVQLYRFREHVLGDIINGKPVYVKTPPFNYTENNYQAFKSGITRNGAVYVAANDGMLHAFDATSGTELWAYIPSFVLPNLKALADDNYSNAHQFYVDGSPTVSDVWSGTAWRTVLVGGLNAGGKGYYALDVTNPATPKVLWEFSDANLGLTFGNPIIGKLADQSWVVVFSSGYNNGDGVGRLYVVNANTGALRFTISTGVGTSSSPSGLGRISAWVDDGLDDNTMQRVYGGDMLGNLWRFDINNSIAPSGVDAFKMAFFESGGVPQPVTTKPELGLIKTTPMVFVGTGRYLGASDVGAPPQPQQSFYALRDDLDATPLGDVHATGSCLVKQTLTVIDQNTRSTSQQPVDLGTNCGWFLDFSPGSFAGDGERVNVDPKLQLGVLAVATNIPEDSVCTVGGSSFLYFFDYTTGQFVSTMTGQVAGQRIGNSIAVGTNTYRLPDGRVVTTVTTSDDKHPVFGNPDNPLAGSIGKRVLWRELLN